MSDLNLTTNKELIAESTRALTNWMETTGTLAKEFVQTLEEASGGKVLKSLKEFGNMFKNMAKASFQTAALSLLMEILQPLIDLFDMFSPIFQAIGLLLQSVFLPVMQDLMPVIKFLTATIIQLIPYAKQLWDIIKFGFIVAFQAVINIIKTVVSVVGGIFMGVWNAIINIFKFIKTLYDVTLAVVWNLIVSAFNFVRDVARAVVNAIIDIINGVMNVLTLGFWADIPHFAQGGIVTQPTVGMIGEAGPEAIIPMNQAGGMLGGESEMHLMDIKDLMEQQLEIQKRQTRGIQRRRFG